MSRRPRDTYLTWLWGEGIMRYLIVFFVAAFAAFGSNAAFATDGYFSQGYGMKAAGMGGAATAMTDDAFGGANNPASMVWVGDRFDVGITWFRPIRKASRVGGTGMGATLDGSATSGRDNFLIPGFGYNKMLNPSMSLGVTVYANGGMDTDYPGGQIGAASVCPGFNPSGAPYNLLCGSGGLHMDLMQLVVAPTFAIKVNHKNSLGVAPLLAYQRFTMSGLQSFEGFSNNPTDVTNNGYDSGTGWGLRVGWLSKLTNRVSVGADYSTEIRMSKFDKYSGLFAEQGAFNIPENYSLGVAIKATPSVTIAADYERINYGDVKSVGNPSTNGGTTIADTLGCSDCRGFGWSNVNVIKLGVEYHYNPKLTLRAGYNHTNNPIQARDVTFNIIAPGVIENDVTVGFTYDLQHGSEITMAYMHAFNNSVTGNSLLNNFLPSSYGSVGQEKVQMYEDSLGIAWGKKF